MAFWELVLWNKGDLTDKTGDPPAIYAKTAGQGRSKAFLAGNPAAGKRAPGHVRLGGMRVLLDIADQTTKLTLHAMLQKDGHLVVSANPDVIITGELRRAVVHARSRPTLLLSSMGDIPEAVGAMRRGVYGYIFLPLQPGEAGLMVERAGASAAGVPAMSEPQPRGTIDDAESRLILATLRQCKYNRTKAARTLGIGRNTLWRKLKKMNWGEMKDEGTVDKVDIVDTVDTVDGKEQGHAAQKPG